MSIKHPKLEELINKLGQDEFLVRQGLKRIARDQPQ